jgi:protein-tyrosine phosphatase
MKRLHDTEMPLAAIDGSFNFRDIGGRETSNGEVVRWRRIYRSGMMVHLTEEGCAQIAGLGVRGIFDLRTTRERGEAPTRWQAMGAVDYWFRDYDDIGADISRVMGRSSFTAGEARDAMFASYQTLAFVQADAYRELFHRIARGHVPIVFNCSAGKDRTGVATALLYTLLGVPRETILHDYALTNEVLAQDTARLIERGVFKKWRDDEAFTPLVQADPAYLSAMFEAVEKKCGTINDFMEEELDIDQRDVDAIRQEMLEPMRDVLASDDHMRSA